MSEEEKRILITEFLQWNDRNGFYTDSNCDMEEVSRMTYEEAMVYFFKAMNEDILENYFTYDDIIQYSKDNNFYDKTIEKLNMLLSGEKYSKIITN